MTLNNKCPISCITATDNKKYIDFDLDLVKELQENRWNVFATYLKDAFRIEKLNNGTLKEIVVSEAALKCLDEWLLLIVKNIQKEGKIAEVLTEILRSLRNCTSNRNTQDCVIEKTNLLINCNILFDEVIKTDKKNPCLKILFQFLINLMSSNKEAATKILAVYYEKIKVCLINQINVYESSALIFYISLVIPISDTDLMGTIFDLYHSENQNEFLIFLLENSIADSNFWNLYREFKMEDKITALEVLKDMHIRKQPHNLPEVGLVVLTNIFLESSDVIFQVKLGGDKNLEICEISLILELISSLSSEEKYLPVLQVNRNILITAGMLLINIHRLGKVSDNCFTPVQKLSEFETNNQELNQHPAFGFKADLVRLIGNLCWKNTEIQNLARTAELLPIILECCNMDARNPFIIQWAILAIRNLCDNNQENQNIIAGLHQRGTVSSEVLDEMGVTLHSDGENNLKIVTLNSLNK